MNRTLLTSSLFLLLAFAVPHRAEAQGSSAAQPAVSANLDPAQPLASSVRAAFEAITPDPSPDELTRGSHYWVSNELAHWVMREHLANIGGVYIGVGTEQNYLLAGWARSAMLVLLDFDQAIGDLHYAYGAFFRASATPAEFLARWDEDRLEEARALLAAELAPDQLEATMFALDHTIDRCGNRLRRLAQVYAAHAVPSFVNDQTEYDFIRNLWLNDRVLIIRGDLTATRAMRGIAAVATAHAMPVRVIYLSNAEQYFDYSSDFIANIEAQPFDERSYIVHTRHFSDWPRVEDDDYHYLLQPGPNFVAWLNTGEQSFFRMVRHARTEQTVGLSLLTRLPDAED